ncbi:MAG: hypothetical protein BWX88_03701 [Planctomycetes bacterium ADurb.Bin126]|nr:MAG: hypothetical protein BWX88_03701 [Planctomycetes bacterium ADurb.Bin126]HOD83474.1 hypothetical protein [Phycisphaerae bacterium]HQL73408.1 hypothetical protein [Phycisphaerae bacterium]
MNLDAKISTPVAIALAVVLIGGGLYWTLSGGADSRPLEVHYPYWCRDCKAVFDVSELKQPGKWRVPQGAYSDSIVLCPRCDKGWAFPAPPCPACGKRFVLHLLPDAGCPYCDPKVVEEAAAKGLDLTPPEIKALK